MGDFTYKTILEDKIIKIPTSFTPKATELTEDQNTGEISTKGDIVVVFNRDQKQTLIEKYKTSTKELLIFVIQKFTEKKQKALTIPVKEFMNTRGLRDYKSTRKTILDDLDALAIIRLRGTFGTLNFFQGAIIENGNIIIKLADLFYDVLLKIPFFMSLCVESFKINNQRNPLSFLINLILSVHKRINMGRYNENIISIKNLISQLGIINETTLKKIYFRHLKRYIITPIERDLNRLTWINWEYCNRAGVPTEKEKLKNITFDEYKKLNIKFTFVGYPEEKRPKIKNKNEFTKIKKINNKTRQK